MSGPLFQQFVDRMLGTVGNALGKPHAVYRITQASNGDFPSGWQLRASAFPVHRNRVTSRDLETNLLSERTLWYQLAGDMSGFALGDVFVSAAASYQPGVAYGAGATAIAGTADLDGFALAWHGMMEPPMGARIDRRVSIYRPDLSPLAMQDGSKRWAVTHEDDTPLILTNGVYVWGQPGGQASWVPCGFGSNDREYRQGSATPDTIGITAAQRYYAYLPVLPGYTPQEGDAIVTEGDERHVIIAPYSQQSGVVGSQMTIERLTGST